MTCCMVSVYDHNSFLKVGMVNYMNSQICMCLTIAAVSMIMDLRWAKVDNGWILFSLLQGLILSVLEQGFSGIFTFSAGALFPFLVLIILFRFRMMGAGDIKLFCALGGVMGTGEILKCILFSLFLGAVISVAILISNGCISQRFLYFIRYIDKTVSTGKIIPYRQKGMASPENFHFTVPIFLSVVLYAGGVY